MKINKYYPFAAIYFFFNSVGLPFGFTYTALLAPVFCVWLILRKKYNFLLYFFLLVLPFAAAHLWSGVDLVFYARSLMLHFTVYVFGYAFYTFLQQQETSLGIMYRNLLMHNFLLTLMALVALFTPFVSYFWTTLAISFQLSNLPRLRMFTYEPSYYSTLLIPLFLYYFTKVLLRKNWGAAPQLLLMAGLPLILSFSMGVLASAALGVAILLVVHADRFLTSKRLLQTIAAFIIVVLLVLVVLLVFYRDNPLFVRISGILAGEDQSGRGRTIEAFQLAYKIAKEKSLWWGVGFGQLKIIGDPIIKEFYQYPPDYGTVSIPSVFAETFASLGLVGAGLRLFVEVWLFFRTNVLGNFYRTLMFFHVFIYQFTGSFTANFAEYVIWILAFVNVFPAFDVKAASVRNKPEVVA